MKQELQRVPEPEAIEGDEVAVYEGMVNNPLHHLLDEKFIDEVLNLGVESGKILDVGCGPGQIPIMLAKRNENFVINAVDLSADMIAVANKNAQEKQVTDRVTFHIADAAKLPFPDNSFDLVISHFFIGHLPTEEKVIQVFNEIERVSKGVIYIEDIVRPHEVKAISIHMKRTAYTDPQQRDNFEASIRGAFSIKEWQEMINKSTLHTISSFAEGVTQSTIGQVFINELPKYQFFKKTKFEVSK